MGAERIKLFEADIDVDGVIKKSVELKQEMTKLKLEQQKLKDTTGEANEEYVKLEAEIKKVSAEYRVNQKQVANLSKSSKEYLTVEQKLTLALNKEVKSINAAKKNNKELRELRNEINTETKEGAEAIATINSKLDKNTDLIKDNTSALEKQKINIGNYPTLFKSAKGAVITFGTALKALGIGLIVAAVSKLTEAFGRNQKVANTVSTVFNAIGIVFDKVVGTIVDTVTAVKEATGGFDALGKVIGGLLTLAFTPLKTAFYGLKLGILEIQRAWESSFLGGKDQDKLNELESKITDTKETLTEIGKKAITAGKQIKDNFGEAFSEVSSLVTETGKAVSKIDFSNVVNDAKALTAMRNNMEALIIAQEGLVQKYEREAELLRQKRDDEKNSIEERRQYNEQLGAVLEKQANAERDLIKTRLSAAQKEASLNKGNIGLQNEVLRLKNEELEVENRIESQRSEKLANDNALRKEQLDATLEFENKKREIQNAIEEQKITDAEERERIKIEREAERHLLELEQMQLSEADKQELRLLLYEQEELALQELKEKYREIDSEADKKRLDDKRKLDQQILDSSINLVGQQTRLGQALVAIKGVLAAKETLIDLGVLKSKVAANAARATGAVAEGAAQTAKVGFPQNIPLLIAFAAQAAGIISAVKSAVAGSKKVSLPKFEKGAVLNIGGKRHHSGGTKFVGDDGTAFEAEEGEKMFILNRAASANLAPLLSDVNQMYGGVSLSKSSSYLAAGGSVLRSTINNNIDSKEMARLIREAVLEGSMLGTEAGAIKGTEAGAAKGTYSGIVDREDYNIIERAASF